jgi:hypothetical protein
VHRVSIVFSIALTWVALLSSVGAVRAQEATPSPAALPEAVAPLRLGTVTLAPDLAGAGALLAQLPATVAGLQRVDFANGEPDRVIVAYGSIDPAFGPPLYILAVDFSQSDFFPAGFTVDDYVAAASQAPDYGAIAYGRDGNLVWVQAVSFASVAGENPATPPASRPLYTLAWGVSGTRLLYSAASYTPDALDALVSAFVDVASAQPATPVSASPVAA